MKNQIEKNIDNENKRSKSKTVIGNSFTWHKRKHHELKEKSLTSTSHKSCGLLNSSSKTNFGMIEKKFKKNENFVKRMLQNNTKQFQTVNHNSCYYSPVKSEFSIIKEVNSCKIKEVTNPNIMIENKQMNSFSSEYKRINENESHNNECSTRINNFKKKIKSSEEIILEEMSRFKFTAQPMKKNLFTKSKFKAKSCSQFIREPKVRFIIIFIFINKNENLYKKNNLKCNLNLKKIKPSKEKKMNGMISITSTMRISSLNNRFINNKNANENINTIKYNSKSTENKASYFSNLLKNVKINVNGGDNPESIKIQSVSLNNMTNEFNPRKKENSVNIEMNLKNSNTNFKARVLPNFAFLEIKKSNKSLTIPKSPELMTKNRSVCKLKIQK